MRGPLAAMLCFVPGIGLAQAMPGAEPAGPAASLAIAVNGGVAMGKVGAIDTVGMSFVSRGRSGAREYWVTRATRFRAHGMQASFYDLRTGERVVVRFHRSGDRDIADVVRLGA